jgi:nitroreductase
MNQVFETINQRRSVRAYEPKQVPAEIINKIVEAGNQAPFTSVTCSQPWRFVVVQDEEFKKKLLQTTLPLWKQTIESTKNTYPEIYRMAKSIYDAVDEPKDTIYYNAPVIIFIIGPASNAVSCALACQNIMIAAQSLGLGSCYAAFGAVVKSNTDIVQTLELKEHEQIYGPILIGYPKSEISDTLAQVFESIAPNKKDPIIKWV